ncbi:hypothetical protein A3J20_00550 [Candidatus Gottesmanbacteria bacterium RIFCSPLOWO2_02_FULL_42_29]|nr:MAG: hypothetical protein A3J20_00550 [Candidatus Gottesmanbacteria bacterium RIFCSPLOWO2_02_FULL_42_29]
MQWGGNLFFYFLFIIAISKANISIVNTNFETISLLSIVIIGIIYLKEKKNLINKIIGSLLCVLGTIFLNFF